MSDAVLTPVLKSQVCLRGSRPFRLLSSLGEAFEESWGAMFWPDAGTPITLDQDPRKNTCKFRLSGSLNEGQKSKIFIQFLLHHAKGVARP